MHATYNKTNVISIKINFPIIKEINIAVNINEVPNTNINIPVVMCPKYLENIFLILTLSYVNPKFPKQATTAIKDIATNTSPEEDLSPTRLLLIK